MDKKTALFPGTFDPFTIGHYSLVARSLQLVDQVIIALGVNDTKKSLFSLESRLSMIRELYSNDSRILVQSYDCLTVDYAKDVGANLIIRGIRSINDFEYEKNIADMNRSLSGIETVILFTEPELTHISSTIVRELIRYGHDVGNFIPKGIDITQKD